MENAWVSFLENWVGANLELLKAGEGRGPPMPGGQGDPSPTQELSTHKHTKAHKRTQIQAHTSTHTHRPTHTGTNTGTHTQTHRQLQTRAGDPLTQEAEARPASPLPGHSSQQAGGCKE